MDGFNTFEKQDRILLGENNTPEAAAAALILRQQGFAVQTFAAHAPADTAALLAALAEKATELDCAFIATGHFARTETDADGVCRILPAVDADADQSALLRGADEALLARLVLPLGEFTRADVKDILSESES